MTDDHASSDKGHQPAEHEHIDDTDVETVAYDIEVVEAQVCSNKIVT